MIHQAETHELTMLLAIQSQLLLVIFKFYSSSANRTTTENVNKFGFYRTNPHKNISDLLDNLLAGYDNNIRPGFGGPPAEIEVNFNVRSMGPISEIDMTYSMDCYFRQQWIDPRLTFHGNKETLALSISMLEKIWKPDTYFYNGKQSYLHTITTPNKFVRLFQNGTVLYSSSVGKAKGARWLTQRLHELQVERTTINGQPSLSYILADVTGDETTRPRMILTVICVAITSKLTIKAACPMNLQNFPMDIQRCPLKFGSFGYTIRDVRYRWKRGRQVDTADDMKLSQFDLVATPARNQTDFLKSGEYSMLLVQFHLQRHMGNFLIQVYGPCILLVVLSWVSFWLNREATADRVSLGIMTMLTMTFLGLEARTDLPKVPYPTALDFFVFMSFGFIFATIIQIILLAIEFTLSETFMER